LNLDDAAESPIKPAMKESVLKFLDFAPYIVDDDSLVSAALRKLMRWTGLTILKTFKMNGCHRLAFKPLNAINAHSVSAGKGGR
jgi:hypothetical protein